MASSDTQAPNITKNASSQNASNQNDDLGIGRIAAETSLERFVNKDGTFNMRREGLGKFSSINPFYWLLDLTFPAFFGIIVAVFFGINIIFTGLYLLCGSDGLTTSVKSETLENPIWRAFFFSVETLSTIGYGHIAPVNMAAHWVSTVQAFMGLLVAAIITGLLFARFSRPNNKILSSRNMLVSPFNGGWGLMCRKTPTHVLPAQTRATICRVFHARLDAGASDHTRESTLGENANRPDRIANRISDRAARPGRHPVPEDALENVLRRR
jgi:Ion channel